VAPARYADADPRFTHCCPFSAVGTETARRWNRSGRADGPGLPLPLKVTGPGMPFWRDRGECGSGSGKQRQEANMFRNRGVRKPRRMLWIWTGVSAASWLAVAWGAFEIWRTGTEDGLPHVAV